MYQKPHIDDFIVEASTSNPSECHIILYSGTVRTLQIPERIQGMTPVQIQANAFSENHATKIVILPSAMQYISPTAFSDPHDTIIYTPQTEFIFPSNEDTHITFRFGFQRIHTESGIQYALFDQNDQKTAYIIGQDPRVINDLYDPETDYLLELETEICGHTVVGIEPYAFVEGLHCEGLVLPKQLSQIGKHAFRNNEDLERIAFPESLEYIGDYAFCGCLNMKEFILPKSVRYIGNGCFSNILYATILIEGNRPFKTNWNPGHLPAYSRFKQSHIVDDLVYSLFEDGTAILTKCIIRTISNVTIPATIEVQDILYHVIEIADFAFMKSRYIRQVSVPSSIQRIGKYAFQKSGISRLVLPPNTVIEEGILFDCINLESIILPSDLTHIPKHMCFNCQSLTALEIPPSVHTIFSCSFMEAINLRQVRFPDGLSEVHAFAFSGTPIKKPTTCTFTHIGEFAFDSDELPESW